MRTKKPRKLSAAEEKELMRIWRDLSDQVRKKMNEQALLSMEALKQGVSKAVKAGLKKVKIGATVKHFGVDVLDVDFKNGAGFGIFFDDGPLSDGTFSGTSKLYFWSAEAKRADKQLDKELTKLHARMDRIRKKLGESFIRLIHTS